MSAGVWARSAATMASPPVVYTLGASGASGASAKASAVRSATRPIFGIESTRSNGPVSSTWTPASAAAWSRPISRARARSLSARRLAALAARIGGHALAHLVERRGMRLAVREGREQVDRVRALDQIAHLAFAQREGGLGEARHTPHAGHLGSLRE